MPISVTFSVEDFLAGLPAEARAAWEAELPSGSAELAALDNKELWYQYLTQNDDRVRPSHAALHGTYWRADDADAPVPPLDYGCRCFIRYVAAPESAAAVILPEATGQLDSRKAAFTAYLAANLDNYAAITSHAATLPPTNRLQYITDQLKDTGVASNVIRDMAYMILSII